MKTSTFKTVIVGLVFCISTILNAQIKPVSPPDGMVMSQVAASFKANSTANGPYNFEISKDRNFGSGVIRKSTTVKGGNTGNVYFLFYKNSSELSPGTWYWRVSAGNGGNWSSVSMVKIETSLPTVNPIREISPKKPLFHARLRANIGTKSDALARIKKIIPDDLKEYLVLDHPITFPYYLEGNAVIEYCEKVNKLGYPFLMDIGRPDGINHESQGDRAVTLSEVEYVFQNFENCIGIASGELFYEYFGSGVTRQFNDAAIDICAKYGRYYLQSDMNWRWNKWSMYSALNYERFKAKDLGRYFVPLYKTTDPWGALTCMSAIQGMGLTGMVDHYGLWSDAWLWGKFGHAGVYGAGDVNHFPYIFSMKAFLLSISQGGTVTGLEPAVQWGDGATPNENYHKYLIPFLRGVVEHDIMISKKAIMDVTKVMVKLDFDPASAPIDYKTDKYGSFYRSTYGLWDGGKDPSREEIIPNTSRYYGIPFLPHNNASVPAGMKLIKMGDVQSRANAAALIDPLYPASTSEAFTIDLDNTIIVLNNSENTNKDQSYNMSLGNSGVLNMHGNMPLMHYIMGKREVAKNQYWFQVNGYTRGPNLGGKYQIPEYPTEIKFTCSAKPNVVVEQSDAVISQNWNPNTKEFTLKFKHDKGAVNFTISGTGGGSTNESVTGVSVSPTSKSLQVGQTTTLTANVAPSNASNKSVTWSSSNTNIASVNNNGVVTAKAIGTARITVTTADGNKKATSVITVTAGGGNGGTTTTVTLSPIHDTYLQGTSNNNNTLIRIENGNRLGYLMFDLSGITGTITSAELKLACTGDAGNGNLNINLGNSTNWEESNLSNSNKPSSGVLLGNLDGSYSIGTNYTADLNTGSISAGGKVSFIITQTEGNDVAFASKENSVISPQLILTYNMSNSRASRMAKSSIDKDLNSKMSIYPNPISGSEFTMEFKNYNNEEVNVSILDIQGRLLYSDRTSKSTHTVPSNIFKGTGMYFVKTESVAGAFTQKLLVK